MAFPTAEWCNGNFLKSLACMYVIALLAPIKWSQGRLQNGRKPNTVSLNKGLITPGKRTQVILIWLVFLGGGAG